MSTRGKSKTAKTRTKVKDLPVPEKGLTKEEAKKVKGGVAPKRTKLPVPTKSSGTSTNFEDDWTSKIAPPFSDMPDETQDPVT
jgi:hypothetical protein